MSIWLELFILKSYIIPFCLLTADSICLLRSIWNFFFSGEISETPETWANFSCALFLTSLSWKNNWDLVCDYSFLWVCFSLSLGILSVLSLSSESMSLASELPKVSYVKAIDIWMIACLLYGFASLVEYAVVQVLIWIVHMC